jgi:hypothetical protein
MKRALFQNVQVTPYNSSDIIDRNNFLSAIFGAAVSAAGTLTLVVTHSDDGVTFVPVTDMRLEAAPATITTNGTITVDVAAPQLVNIDIDLVGCKQYVQFTASGVTAAYAYALGDVQYAPV